MAKPVTSLHGANNLSGTRALVRPTWVASMLLPSIHPVHGRGYVATEEIASGTLLLVVPDIGAQSGNQVEPDRIAPQVTTEVAASSRVVSVENAQSVVVPEQVRGAAYNACFSGPTKVIASRAIRAGEPIAIDYSRKSWSVSDRYDSHQSALSAGASVVVSFLQNALRNEWGAAVVSFTSAIPSNLLSCVIVVWGAEWLKKNQVFESEAAYISAVSILTGFIGYATYLLGYYGGMLLKERADLRENGVFSWSKFKRKWRVIWYDFVIHLPSDVYSLPLLSASQGGMYVAGVSQFWSIFWAQAIADAFSAVKEPFFWHGAKKLAEFTERKAANVDSVFIDDRAAND